MNNVVLVIGGTGMIGKIVVEMLARSTIKVYSLQRSQKRVSLLKSIEYIKGDVANYSQIKRVIDSLVNLTHIYFHPPASMSGRGKQKVDLQGTKNILRAIKGSGIHFVKLSEIGAWDNPCFFDISQKFQAETVIRASSSKWTILQPTWFMESIPNLLTRGKFSVGFGNRNSSIYWLAGEDYAKTVAAVVKNSSVAVNKTFVVQGPEPISLPKALKRYNRLSKNHKITLSLPLSLLKVGYYLSPSGRFNYEIMNYYDKRKETFESKETWSYLHKPRITLEAFAKKRIQS